MREREERERFSAQSFMSFSVSWQRLLIKKFPEKSGPKSSSPFNHLFLTNMFFTVRLQKYCKVGGDHSCTALSYMCGNS